MKALVIFGTRPEAIKMAPVVSALREREEIDLTVCVTAQHRQMLDQVLRVFGIVPDFDLDLMRPGQELHDITSRVLLALREILVDLRPDLILVHGDTTTAMAAALCAFYLHIPIGHVEAGLRTGDIHRPWPEEMNRKVIDTISRYLFAPTQGAREALLGEGYNDRNIFVTGNTVVDALLDVSTRIDTEPGLRTKLDETYSFLQQGKRLILVTGHRRESFGSPFEEFCTALIDIASTFDCELLYPVHLNSNVQRPVKQLLCKKEGIRLIEPVSYVDFVYLLKRAHFIITDSGGIQEEAPALGKPVLVTRDVTERPEAIAAGTALLVGTKRERIVSEAGRLLTNSNCYRRMSSANNPYGDGKASKRIAEHIVRELKF